MTAGTRARLEELERSGLDSRSSELLVVLCWLVRADIAIDEAELNGPLIGQLEVGLHPGVGKGPAVVENEDARTDRLFGRIDEARASGRAGAQPQAKPGDAGCFEKPPPGE